MPLLFPGGAILAAAVLPRRAGEVLRTPRVNETGVMILHH